MVFKHRFKIVWRYSDGFHTHTSFVEVRSKTVRAALKRFHSFFNWMHKDCEECGIRYAVESVVCLGKLPSLKW